MKQERIWAWIVGLFAVMVLLVFAIPYVPADNKLLGRTSIPQVGIGGGPQGELSDIVAIVTNADRTKLVGQRVAVTGVPVVGLGNDGTFWIGPSVNQKLLVALRSADTAISLGERVNVTGVLRLLPTIEQMKTLWHLTDQETTQLQREVIYLDAEQMTVLQ